MAANGPRIFRVLLEVSNLDAAVAFYTELLATPGRPVRGGRHYFDCGDLILGLLDVSAEGREAAPMPQNLYFAVDDLEEVHRRAEALGCLSTEAVHGESGGGIATRPWGERSFYASDPFGNLVCFVDAQTLFTGR